VMGLVGLGLVIYGLTRDRTHGWRNWFVGGGFAVIVLMAIWFPEAMRGIPEYP
jgi:hypothetical protein